MGNTFDSGICIQFLGKGGRRYFVLGYFQHKTEKNQLCSFSNKANEVNDEKVVAYAMSQNVDGVFIRLTHLERESSVSFQLLVISTHGMT